MELKNNLHADILNIKDNCEITKFILQLIYVPITCAELPSVTHHVSTAMLQLKVSLVQHCCWKPTRRLFNSLPPKYNNPIMWFRAGNPRPNVCFPRISRGSSPQWDTITIRLFVLLPAIRSSIDKSCMSATLLQVQLCTSWWVSVLELRPTVIG